MLLLRHLVVLTAILLLSVKVLSGPSNGNIGFDEHLLDSNFSYVFGLSVSDFDKNGFVDIAVSDTWVESRSVHNGARVILYRNFKDTVRKSHIFNGRFDVHKFRGVPTQLLERSAVGDVNDDGLPDLAVVDLTNNRVLVFINPGSIDAGQWAVHILAQIPYPVEIRFSDINADGKEDLVATSWNGGGVWWARNNGSVDKWPAELIGKPDGWGDTRGLFTADFDGDGRIDVIASDLKAGGINLFRKTTSGWQTRVLWSTLAMPWHGDVVDWDGDGAMDIVIGDRDGIYALLNAEPWKLQKIVQVLPEQCDCEIGPSWFEVLVRDMNGDGRKDLVATRIPNNSRAGGEVYWFENLGDGWRPHRLAENWGRPNAIRVADLNNDGMPDIVAISERPSNEVRYWLNTQPSQKLLRARH